MSMYSLLSKYSYADVRIEKGIELLVKISEQETKVSSGDYVISSARVIVNGSWGFASSNKPNPNIADLVKKAASLASIEKANVKLKKQKKEKILIKVPTSKISDNEKIIALQEGAKEIAGEYITNKSISYRDWFVQKEFYNSEDREILESFNRAYLSCTAVAKDGFSIQRGRETDASIGGFKKIRILETAREAKKKAERSLLAKPPPNGRFVTLLDPEIAGVFCHEALGHACEADSIIERESILRGKLGKQIASQLVTIVDDPTSKNFGYYNYDDEGIKSQRVELVKKGVLSDYINSRETAYSLRTSLNGHCRAQDAEHVPIVRMSNTFMMPGKSKLNELFDLRHGIYVKGMSGGSVDIFSGSFMFKAEEAYEINHGEKGDLLRDVSLSGNILETLKFVELVGNDFGTSPGICGKYGQGVPVSDGGPHIRISNMKIG